MDSTNVGLKMCAGGFGLKWQEKSKHNPSDKLSASYEQAQVSHPVLRTKLNA
jgi:hypothetical protein